MRNFQVIVFNERKTYRDIFKSALVYLQNSSTSNSEVPYSTGLNSASSNSATLKATLLNSGRLLIKKELLCKLNATAFVIM